MSLKDIIFESFYQVALYNERSLLEEDFFDTHYRYFEDIDDSYLKAIESNEADLILKYGFDYSQPYLDIALAAAKGRCRTLENRVNWLDITYDYLYFFSVNCSSLEPNAFKFYLPAVFIQCIENYIDGVNVSFVDYFIARLIQKNPHDYENFTPSQCRCIAEFLRYYKKLSFIDTREISELHSLELFYMNIDCL